MMNSKVSISMSTSSADSFGQHNQQHNILQQTRGSSQKRLLHSDSSISYQMSHYRREDSIQQPQSPAIINELLSRNLSSYMNQDDDEIETTTSRSFIHGFILVSVMISSLIAFICSKVRRCSSTTFSLIDVNTIEDCSKYFHFYSTMTIISCLITFLIYFLHLIAQCDILCLTRKKYEYEITTIVIIGSLLSFSIICYSIRIDIFAESFTLTSLILSTISSILYFIRAIILIFEMIQQRRKRYEKKQSFRDLAMMRRSISKDQSSVAEVQPTTTKVISYVRSSQRTKTISTSVSDDLEDDVFIQ
ncbi:hypothetical protein RDWZM_007120 [Blomia tropicalis]|uniref:Transmembrane protein n=1 Tax=Blomia tropicalis TaxID=40697 RepID=A0A9Q0M9S9_BLOTA|nr:hypothetical protein RDWZM_007120 [Blomia tropicalis]